MSPLRASALGLGLLAMACTPRAHAVRRDTLPPPAPVSRAGTPIPGAGPAPGPETRAAPPPRPLRSEAIRRAIETAAGLVGNREIVVAGRAWGDGCAALVRAAFASAGAPFPARARDAIALHALARERAATRRGRPSPGDLVFLADRPGGPPEHVGLVEAVNGDGTALVIHRTDKGVLRVRLNGAQPWKLRSEDGRALNDVLLVGAGRVSAGRLVVAYATIL
jgi:hypothetical protein